MKISSSPYVQTDLFEQGVNTMIFGCERVSSKDQILDRQLIELAAFGCERIYQKKALG